MSEPTHELAITFVSATSRPGLARPFYADSLMRAIERQGVPTRSLRPVTKVITVPGRRVPGYVSTRGIPLSFRFILDVVRAPTPFVGCGEYGFETLLTLVASRLCGKKTLVFQQHVGRAGAPLSRVDVGYRRLIGRLATAFIANTGGARDEIVDVLRVAPERVYQVMVQVPPDRAGLCLGHIDIGRVRMRPLFLNVGRLIEAKNVEAILQAARLLLDEGLEFEVWVVGAGPDEERLRRIAERSNLGDAVRFLGTVPYTSVGLVYAACDVVVQPSRMDYLSNVVLEAMRFGKAVICSTGVGAAGVVARDRINAFVFDPDAPSELADCMRRFIVEPQLAAEMGRRSAAMMAEHTPDRAAAAVIDVMRRLASRGDKAAKTRPASGAVRSEPSRDVARS